MRQRRTKWRNVLTGEQGSVMLAALDARPPSGIGHVRLRETPR
ncbi:hypothetical protein [Microbispora catharanthi]|nr:hypothetical protein [Microbispora catharanthi]